MKKIIFFILVLFLLSCMAASKKIPFPELNSPDSITVDDDRVYITQFPVVYIYSLKDFKLIRKFGMKGEGPKEFNKFALLYVHHDRLIISDRGKVLFFTKNGDYIKEIKAQSIMHWGVKPLANKFVCKSRTTEKKVTYDTVNIYDSNLKKEKEMYRSLFFYQPKGAKKCNPLRIGGVEFHVFKKKVFIKGEQDSIIHVFDDSGKKQYSIKIDPGKIKISEPDKKRYHDYFKSTRPWKRLYNSVLKNELKFPPYYPAIRMFIAADSKLYVLTYRYENEEGKSEFLVLDLQGNPLRKALVPFDVSDTWFHYSLKQQVIRATSNPTFTVKGGKLYQMIENPDTGEWELHINKI